MKIERIGDAMLILGDCRDWFASVPACLRVDAMITDPPYGINYAKYESHQDEASEYPALLADVRAAGERLVKDGWMCVYQSATTAPKWAEWFGATWRIIALPKTFVQIRPGVGPTWATDYAITWPVGKPVQRGKLRDWFVCETSDMSKRPKGHPCPRPLNGVSFLVEALTEPGATVLDPFMGSGTTGVACATLGRKFIGVEMEPKYFDLACERISRTQAQGSLINDAQESGVLFA